MEEPNKLTIHEIATKMKELAEQYGEEAECGMNLNLCETVILYSTIFFDMRRLLIDKVGVIDGEVFLTDKRGSFIITMYDEENLGEMQFIYENLLVNGPGCSEVGECEDVDSEDLDSVLKIVLKTIKQRA